MATNDIINAYIEACYSGDSRLQRILADRLSALGIDADEAWNQE